MKVPTIGFQLKASAASDEADLYIFDDIGEYEDWESGQLKGFGPKKLTDQLADCNAKTITVHINSYGGDVYDGIAVHNILKGCGKTVNVIVDGIAASAASIIAMAGESVKMYKSSQLMIHNCWTIALGNAEELRKIAGDMDKVMESCRSVYLDKAKGKLTDEHLARMLADETRLTASEAYTYGLCTEIIEGAAKEPAASQPQTNSKTEPTFIANQTKKCWFF